MKRILSALSIIVAMTFISCSGHGYSDSVATLCYGTEFNEYVKQLVTPKTFSYVKDSTITRITFITDDRTTGQVKVSDAGSEFPIYASLDGTEVIITTPASSIRAGRNSSHLFSGFANLRSIGNLDVIDFSECEDFSYMFNRCCQLESIDLSSFVTGKSMTFAYMFCYCQKVRTLDVSKFETGNALSLCSMFQHCESVTRLDIKGFDLSRCRNMDKIFDGCMSLEPSDKDNLG